jgi:hypothetical protein
MLPEIALSDAPVLIEGERQAPEKSFLIKQSTTSFEGA